MKLRLLAVVAVTLLLAADKPKGDPAKKEYAAFEGTWKIESMVMNGEKVSADQFKGVKLILKGNKFTMKMGDMDSDGTYKVNLDKKPKHIDVTFTNGLNKGQTLKGIYELKGDTYKVCIAMEGKARPKELASKKDSGTVFEVFKRVKAEKKK
jgi:uncharacterized protein (TIGR03067 family)